MGVFTVLVIGMYRGVADNEQMMFGEAFLHHTHSVSSCFFTGTAEHRNGVVELSLWCLFHFYTFLSLNLTSSMNL